MKINLNFEYDKLHLKEITILIPKYHPNMVSFLTPVLGLYGINVKEFITDFEKKTKFIAYDVIIPARVKISKIKTFEIMLKTPYIIPILSQVNSFSLTKPDINVLTFYKLSLIKSIFSLNHLASLQNRIYVSIRKYISSTVKTISSVTIKKPNFNLPFIFDSTVLQIKKNLNSLLFSKKLIFNNYGVFVNFNNVNNSYINYLQNSLSTLNIGLLRINPKMVNIFTSGNYFTGQNYYLFSNRFSYMHNFYKQFLFGTFSANMFPVYFKFGSNLLTTGFFKKFLSDYQTFNTIQLFKITLKLLHSSLRSINYLNLSLLKLLKYNANLPSNISKS